MWTATITAIADLYVVCKKMLPMITAVLMSVSTSSGSVFSAMIDLSAQTSMGLCKRGGATV